MEQLLLSKNILHYRQQANITQDQLAKIIGVTKAAVSKWETGQSLPDILILPKLASYFNLSIDELLGYSRQMSPAQVINVHKQLLELFVTLPIEEAFEACKQYVKDYYHCYPLLVKICGLYANHLDLIPTAEFRQTITQEIIELANHIIKHSDELHVLP